MNALNKQYDPDHQIDLSERNRLLMENLGQVRYIARRIHGRLPSQVDLQDLVHAGVLGLIDALHKYDPGRDIKLTSYAKFRIRGSILDSLRKLDWSPRDLRRKARRIEQGHRNIEAQFGRVATNPEVAADMGVSLQEYEWMLAELRGLDLGSLEDSGREDSGPPDMDRFLRTSPDQDPFQLCMRSEARRLLENAIEQLPARERHVLALYYFEELTMKEVGAVLGVNESRVSQIHSAAMVRLRVLLQQLRASRQSLQPAGAPVAAGSAHGLSRTDRRRKAESCPQGPACLRHGPDRRLVA